MTRTLTLKNRFQGNSTIIENDFIDHHMAKANGEYVKVYLLLLRHLHAENHALSISALADYLECTEKDVLRAFKHWSKEGLLKIDYDEAGNICGLAIGNEIAVSEGKAAPIVQKKTTAKTLNSTKKENQDELRQLYFVAEQYIGKPLSASEIKKINFFFDTLNFSIDLIEYLIEYCVENGHKSMHYIRKVALSWHEQNIKTVDVAKSTTVLYNKNYYSILNAYGIKGRGPAASEIAYIRKWTDEYHFSQEIILEACDRTMNMIHQPSFDYTDSILKKWFDKNVHTLKDIEVLDENHLREKERQKRQAARPASASSKDSAGNKFNNFDGRSYDMSELERKLVQQ